MTQAELVSKAMVANGIRSNSDAGHLDPIMPWIIMDRHYCLYHDDIEGLSCGQREQMFKTEWEKAYRNFNHPFWTKLDKDTAYELTLLLDEFEKYTHNEIQFLRIAVMSEIGADVDVEVRKSVSSAYVCKIIACIAQSFYKRHFKKLTYPLVTVRDTRNPHYVKIMRDKSQPRWEFIENKDIDAVINNAYQWYCEYMRMRGIRGFAYTDSLQKQTNALVKRAMEWLKNKNNEK